MIVFGEAFKLCTVAKLLKDVRFETVVAVVYPSVIIEIV